METQKQGITGLQVLLKIKEINQEEGTDQQEGKTGVGIPGNINI